MHSPSLAFWHPSSKLWLNWLIAPLNLNGYSIHLSTEITPISLMWSVPPVTLAKGLSAKIKSKTETDIASKHMRKH